MKGGAGRSPAGDQVFSEVADFLSIAAEEWLDYKREQQFVIKGEQFLEEQRQQRRSRLRDVTGHNKQVAEVDSRIDLVMVTPGVPNRTKVLADLSELRERLLRGQR